MHFVHAYVTYQLLSRRIQRDLLLVSALLSSEPPRTPGPQPKIKAAKANAKSRARAKAVSQPQIPQIDGRLYPAVVKLLDTILQSFGQMRTLSIVDDSPDIASAID